jgi:hypothetical protein
LAAVIVNVKSVTLSITVSVGSLQVATLQPFELGGSGTVASAATAAPRVSAPFPLKLVVNSMGAAEAIFTLTA